MAALREGSCSRRHRRVRVRSSSTVSRSPAVHARPDGMPTRRARPAPRHRRSAPAVRRHGAPARHPRARGLRDRTVRGVTGVGAGIGRDPTRPRHGSRRRANRWTSSAPRPICSSSKTTSPGSRCSASAWAATTCSRRRRSTASTPRSRSTAWCARPRRGNGPGPPHRAAGGRGARWRRRWPSSAPTIRGRPRPTSRRCAPRGAGAPIARSSSSKAPNTASSTTPKDRVTYRKGRDRLGTRASWVGVE